MMRTTTFLGIVGGLLLPASLTAQADPRLQRVAPEARAEVARVIDSLHTLGIPAEPLVDKALEGTAKHASAALIAAAVRRWGESLGAAQGALGPRASEAAVVAGASALRSGVATAALAQIAAARPGRDMLVPLAVLTELTTVGVPVDSAVASVLQVAQRGGDDEAFRDLQRGAANGRSGGAAPATPGRGNAGGGPPASNPGRGRGRGRP